MNAVPGPKDLLSSVLSNYCNLPPVMFFLHIHYSFNKNLLKESINKILVSQHSMNQVKFGWRTMTELTHLILRIVPFGNMPTL